MACVISIGHWTNTASTKCIYESVRQSGTSSCPDPSVHWWCHFHSQSHSMPVYCYWYSCSGTERCVLKCTCTLPSVRITAECKGGSSKCRWQRQHSSRGAVCEAPRNACMLRKQSMQTACIHTMCRIATSLASDLAQKLAQPQSLRPDAVRPSHDSVSNTILFHGQMRILTAVERNLILRSGVCVWMISSLVLSSSKVVLQEGRTHGSCRTNCPDFWKMCRW